MSWRGVPSLCPYLFDTEEERLQLVDTQDGKPVAPLEMRARDGRSLGVDEVEIHPATGAA
jgi:hypothetical protein